MTNTLPTTSSIEHSNSYQHIQGCMLLNLNKLACEIKLTHSEFRLMATLIGLFNKVHCKAFPTISQLAYYCSMGNSTIIKNLNNLVKLGLLVVVKTSGKRNNYYFSNLILDTSSSTHAVTPCSTPCSNAHDKQIKNKTNREQTSCQERIIKHQAINDDVLINNSNKTEYRQLVTILKSWSFTGGEFAIKQYGIDKIKDLIEVVRANNPTNKGAYLRSLLNSPGIKPPETKNNPLKSDFKGNDFTAKPQNNNKVCQALEHIKSIQQINDAKPTKEEIIQKLIFEGKQTEALQLKKLWKI